jgi:hypothetical protein
LRELAEILPHVLCLLFSPQRTSAVYGVLAFAQEGSMEHKGFDQLRSVASVASSTPREVLTRRERLERWAWLVENHIGADFAPLPDDCDPHLDVRSRLRYPNSPLDCAFADPLLRVQGLASESLGDCMAFFGLGEDDVLRILDDPRMDARSLSKRIRGIAAKRDRTMMMAGIVTGGVACVPFLAYLFG